jgi:hypothetical protein
MVVGGGGGGGADGGSGGGGGEMRSGTAVAVGSSMDIDIGAGGVGGSWGSYGGYSGRGSSSGSDTTLTWSSSVQYRAKGGRRVGWNRWNEFYWRCWWKRSFSFLLVRRIWIGRLSWTNFIDNRFVDVLRRRWWRRTGRYLKQRDEWI